MTGSPFTKPIFTLLVAAIVLGFAVESQSVAEDQPSMLSGRVISTEGEPLAEAAIALLYVKIEKDSGVDTLYSRSLYPFLSPSDLSGKIPNEEERQAQPPFLKSKTDSEGQFTFTGIATGMVQLMVLPIEKGPESPRPTPQNLKPVPEIQTIKFGEVTFHPHEFSFFPPIGAVTFAIKPGSHIKNVEVTIDTRPKLRIQGRLVFKNGEPLANTTVKFDIGRLGLDGVSGSVFSRSLHTDADGNFVSAIHAPGTYALSVNHRGLSAMSAPFTVEAGKPHEVVVLRLSGNPADLSELSSEISKEPRYGMPDIPGVWIVNPTNGHAYKWIDCDHWKDARVQAADEDAHLVTITSEAEQIWLEAIFGAGPYLIGLTDLLKEGEWSWETGEPVTYTNWGEVEEDILGEPPALLKVFGVKNRRQRHRENQEDYVIMSSRWDKQVGKWYPADSKSAQRHGGVRMAILEKDGM